MRLVLVSTDPVFYNEVEAEIVDLPFGPDTPLGTPSLDVEDATKFLNTFLGESPDMPDTFISIEWREALCEWAIDDHDGPIFARIELRP